MIVGIDFDNTLVGYDRIFHRIALERGLIGPDVPANKTAVRDFMRRAGNESAWTELQGVAYGPRLAEAEIFPGAKEFVHECRMRGVTVKIISHKTRYPYAGERHDLQAAARDWLARNGLVSAAAGSIPADAVFFEATKQEKLRRIAVEDCTVFIDDLPEFLAEPAFPAGTRRILFDPLDAHLANTAQTRARSWAQIGALVFGTDETGRAGGEIGDLTGALFAAQGLHLAHAPARIAGGGNNRAYEAWDDRNERYFLKHYFSQPGDARDRFEAERLFYGLAALRTPDRVPRALGWDEAARLALFEFVPGRKLAGSEIGGPEVSAAFDFLKGLNTGPASAAAKGLPLAAEACFTLAEHCHTVDRRLARLGQIPAESAIDREAARFVAGELADAWHEVRLALTADARKTFDEPWPEGARLISPSDFGFHNCLRTPGGALVFFDFEYAGWDDPAKTVCDFFCQPALPPPRELFDPFARELALALGMGKPEELVARCRMLLPLYCLKWCCIMLNEFVATGLQRRAFALGREVAEESKIRQLTAARAVLTKRGADAPCPNLSHG